MNKNKLNMISIPNYTVKEEKINSLSHIAGAFFGIAAMIISIIISFRNNSAVSMFSSFIYGGSLIALFSVSGIYHGLKISNAKRIFRVIDHCAVFILIAGSYTPILLCGVRLIDAQAGYIMFAAVWALSIAGVILNTVNFNKFKNVTLICCILTGWVVLWEIYPLYLNFGKEPIILLVAGGLCYTAGSLLYAIGKKKKYFHSIFHFFVLAGSVIHFITTAKYFL